MIQSYTYTPSLWPSALVFLLLVYLAVYSGGRRHMPGALPFMIACLFGAVLAAGSVLEYAAVDAATRIGWYQFSALFQVPVVVSLFCFILEFAWPGRWLTRRNLVLLGIVPAVLAVLVVTNDLHHLAWTSIRVDGIVSGDHGPAGLFAMFFAFVILGGINLLVFGWLFLRSPAHRWPVALMLAGQLGGHLIWILVKYGFFQSNLPVPLLGMSFEFFMYSIAFFGFRILDPISIARNTALEQLHSGMLVLDPQGKVISLNPAARAIVGKPEKLLIGRSLQGMLPGWPVDFLLSGTGQADISLGYGPDARVYQVEVSSLDDWRGFHIGRLLMIRDITDQKHAQAQILEQQRSLAMLQERERLAHELHDSTGQVLGFVNLQAQAIAKWVREGNTATAEAQLARLAAVSQDALVDLRDSILSLRSGGLSDWSFLAALQQHLASYQENYGICTGLVVSPDLSEADFASSAGVQLVRVIQEALTNARKHSQARNIQVIITRQCDHAVIVVADDGAGFNPAVVPGKGNDHFGLAFMRERIAQIGGSIEIDSTPGSGTRVRLFVPLNHTQRYQSAES